MIGESLISPFKYLELNKNVSVLWIMFSLMFGLFGIAFNIFAHIPQMIIWDALLNEFAVNSFYTYSIVLLASSMGSLFIKLNKDKMLTFSTIKLWLMVILFFVLFMSAFLCQGMEKFSHHFWMQFAYFVISIALAIYSFCVCHLDECPDEFANLQTKYSEEEKKELTSMITQSQKVTTDSNGNKI